MVRYFILAIMLSAIAFIPASATVINIPEDYSTIQEGIDVSTDGDTVLVQPGTYVENVNFDGHNITLGSRFLITDSVDYIYSTIIDGNSSGSVVTFENGEDSTAIITGFTIQNGYAGMEYGGEGGGINCINSNPVIFYNRIQYNRAAWGGGINCRYLHPRISHNRIRGNRATQTGGGINCYYTDSLMQISYNVIHEDTANIDGGGINCHYSDPEITNNTIYRNEASNGGGILSDNSCPRIINNTIALNNANLGGGILCWYNSCPEVINTILWDNSASESGPEIWDDCDLSVTYSDVKNTLWPGEGNISVNPLFQDPDNDNFHLMSTECEDPYNSLCIDAGDPSIRDSLRGCYWGLGEIGSDMGAYGGGGIFEGEGVVCSVGNIHNYISNWTIDRNTGTNHLTIMLGGGYDFPSMLWTLPPDYADDNNYLYHGSLRLGYRGKLVHLSTDTSPGIEVLEPPDSYSDFDTHFHISDQSDRIPDEDKIGVRVHQYTYAWAEEGWNNFINYDYWIVNLNPDPLESLYVALHADCDVSSAGGGSGAESYWIDDWVGYYHDAENNEYISFMYDGDNPDIPGDDTGGRLEPKESLGYIGSRLLYCPPIVGETEHSVQQGHSWWDSYNDPGSDEEWFERMSDGLWQDPPTNAYDYRYMQKTGPFRIPGGDSIRVAFGFGIGEGLDGLREALDSALVEIEDEDMLNVPRGFFLAQNYPNPLNASTIIQYGLLSASDVTIEIYDILGRRVETLAQGRQPAGYHQITWGASDHSTGIYFYKILAGEYTETRKMVLLK